MDKKLFEKLKGYLGDKYEPSDDELIILYCETHELYVRMRNEISQGQLMMEHTNKAGATNFIKNPLAIEMTKIVQVLNNLLKSLGLTAAQRKEAVGGGGNEKDDFEKY